VKQGAVDLAILLIFLASCSHEPAPAVTPTLGALAQSVRSNMMLYTNRTARGKVPMNKQTQVQAAKARFDLAYRLALEANMGSDQFPAHGDVLKAAQEIEALTKP
jgi:hypothetical protein